MGNIKIESQREKYQQINTLAAQNNKEVFNKFVKKSEDHPDELLVHEFTSSNINLKENIVIKSYPDFGLFIYKSEKFYLAIRCWPGREPYHSSHMHFDQLSLELTIDDKELISDSGSYLYTPFPEIHWKYRSAEAHFTPYISKQYQPQLAHYHFSQIKPKPLKPIYFGINGFLSLNVNDNPDSYYLIVIEKNKLRILSYGFERKQYSPLDLVKQSLGYGVLSS